MKKITFGLLCFIILLPSCKLELTPVVINPESVEFHASFFEDPVSKTVRQSDGKVFWSPGEDIHIFQGSRSGKFTSKNDVVSASATFTGTFNSNTDDGSDYWAVYPWDNDNLFIDWAVYVPIQSYQIAKAGTFDDNYFPSIAKSASKELTFYNVCGGIKFKVYNSGVKKVILSGNNEEVIAGSALVEFVEGRPSIRDISNSVAVQSSKRISVVAPDEGTFVPGVYYYIVVPPISFSNGFILTFVNTENLEASFVTDNSITVSRSKFGVLNDLDKDLVFEEGEEAQRAAEREALVSIYTSLNGVNWAQQTNWLTESPVGTWSGVTTNEDGFVKSLWLYDSNIAGSFPGQITQLSHLESLSISGNVSGSIPSTIGVLTNLKNLSITSESLSGTIPSGITNLTNLENFGITNSSIGGELPDDIGDLVNLRTLSLMPFNGSGPLPASISNLSKLETLEISNADFDQDFPEEVVGLLHLTTLTLSDCGLTGSIPSEIGGLSNLRYLNLQGNSLSGQIPSSLGSLDNLISLSLSENSFTGFPDNLSQCDALREVYIQNNTVSMTFDNDIWSAPSLEVVNISDSNISGTLSAEIENAVSLQILNICRNQFSGSLPSEMSNMAQLRELDIHNNQFTGSIPDSFSALTQLESFIAYNNYMSGSICEEVVLLDSFDKWLLLPQYDDGVFTYSLYESTDFTGHRTVSLIHESTVGNGIDIVLMGEAFTDRDIANGTYDYAMNLACGSLFEVEPFKSYEDRFNVYAIKLVSSNGHVNGETAIGIDYNPILGSQGYSHFNNALNIVDELIPGLDREQLTIGIIVNNLHNGGACCACWNGSSGITPFGSGYSISVVPNRYVDGEDGIRDFKYTLIHELVGHGFGKLDDEYARFEERIDDSNVNRLNDFHETYGWAMNISTTNDLEHVPWKAFLTIPEYVNDGTTIIEGGHDVTMGVWRPSSTSIMSCDYTVYPYFNAPSREAIYRRIHLISEGPGWVYDFDDFVEWDAKNLLTP